MQQKTRTAEDFEQLVSNTRRRLRKYTIFTGVAAVVIATVGWLTATAVLDVLFPLAVPMRVVVGSAFWIILVGALVSGVAWPGLRRLHLEGIAYRIERTIPGMHNRLITALDLRRRRVAADPNDDFVHRLLEQTASRLDQYFRIDQVASPRPMRVASIGAGIVLVVSVVLMAVFHDRIPTAMARVLRPTAPIAPVSLVRLSSITANAQILQGDPLTIEAVVDRGRVDGLTCRLRGHSEKWYDYRMQPREDGVFTHTITRVNESLEYQIRGGGTWTASYAVTMISRPIVEKLDTEVHLPDYMGISEPRQIVGRDMQVSAPAGSTIALTATVAGQVQSGAISLFEPDDAELENRRENEIVWFDDDLPPDAVPFGQWQWVSDTVFSGSRAHTFDWSRKPYGFATRLDRLTVAPDASFFIYVRIDPRVTPTRLTIGLEAGGTRYDLQWTAEASEREAGERQFNGELPLAGQWVRLEVPMSQLGLQAGAQFERITFEIDRGRVLFDRAGALEQTTGVDRQLKLKRTGNVAMSPVDEVDSPGEWSASFPAESDCYYAVTFKNELEHPSPTMKPVHLVVTTDESPTVVIEKPSSTSLLLDEPVSVPLMARAFDDYGVASVAIQYGKTAEEFAEPEPIGEAFTQPRISRLVLTAIDPKEHELEPGQSLYCRLVVADYKGQTTHSPPLQLTLAAPEQKNDDALVRKPGDFTGLLDGIAELIGEQTSIFGSLGELVASVVPEAELPHIKVDGVVELVNPDGTPMTAEQIRELFADASERMTDEQAEQLSQLNEQLRKQQMMYQALADRLSDVAGDVEQSPLALPDEALLLQMMAHEAGQESQYAQQLQEAAAHPEMLADLGQHMSEMNQMMHDMEAEIRQLEQARGDLEQDPLAAQRRMRAMVAMMEGRRAVRSLQDLTESVQQQQLDLTELRQQLEGLAHETLVAPPDQLDALSEQQQELDEEALDELKQSSALLQDGPAEAVDETEMLAPWTPPRRFDQMPVEQDTPEEDPEDDEDGQEEEDEQEGQEQEPEELNWWDRRAPFRQAYDHRGEQNERFADRSRAVDAPSARDDESEEISPREMFEDHQRSLNQQLTQNSNDLARASQQIDQMSNQLQSLVNSLNREPNSGMPRQPYTDQQLRQMMASPQLRRMMSMASRARALALMPARGAMPTRRFAVMGLAGTAGPVTEGYILGDVDLSPNQRAAVYRLPPKLREPLVRGMRETGPEGYQPLIDAYYRRLAKEVE